MVALLFSQQKGAQRQRSLNAFKLAMTQCGNDLQGIVKHTREGRKLKSSLQDPRVGTLLASLGHLIKQGTATKQQLMSIVKSSGFQRTELTREHHWEVSSGTWSRVNPDTGLLCHKNKTVPRNVDTNTNG
jgi:hypothetical protein